MARAPEEYVIIVAGGTGTRLWPLSRKARPKQFLNIFGDQSFIQTVYRRALKITPQKRVFIVAPEDYSAYLKQYLPEFPQENFMGEPVKKGTTAAYGYTAVYIKQLNPDAILHIIAADDYLEDESKYVKALKEAAKIALAKDALVIYGVKPRDPNTGYGYVQVDLGSRDHDGTDSYLVKSFHEKPIRAEAERYLQSGDYFWHVFGFTVTVSKLLALIAEYDPATSQVLDQIESDLKLPARLEAEKLKEHYLKFVESNIDNQVLEKMTGATYMVVFEETWSDVGTWDHVYALMKKDDCGNVIIGDKKKIFCVGAMNSLLIPGKNPLALVGVNNLVVIDAGDVLLICDKTKAQDVKKLVNLLQEKKLNQYL
ncbi:MAG: sugar phosphate nucleotidyltransferase [Patescibacteria group bacterium]